MPMTRSILPLVRRRASAAPARPARRGVAMLLVLVALSAATVLSTTYIVSKDSTPLIGQNAANATASEFAARSAAGVAVAVLQTQANWTGDADPAALIADFTLAGAKVNVYVTDLQGAAPTSSTTDLLVTSTATVGAVRRVSQRVVKYQSSVMPSTAVDPALGEFAVFATNGISVDDTSGVALWPLSPGVIAGKKARLGAGFASSSNLTLGANAKLTDTALVVGNSGSAALKSKITDSRFVKGDTLPIDVPAVAASIPSSITSAGLLRVSLVNKTYDGAGASTTLANDGKFANINLDHGAVVTLDAAKGADYSFNVIDLNRGGTLLVKGAVRIEARNSFGLNNQSAILLADASSSVEIYCRGSITIDDSAVGAPASVAANSARTMALVPAYIPSDRVKFFSLNALSGGTSGNNVQLKRQSLCVASFHVPGQTMVVDESSTILGRATAAGVILKNGASLYYDPALDNNTGFASRSGPLYDSAGAPRPGLVASLATIGASTGMQAVPGVLQTSVGSVTLVSPSPGTTPRAAARAVGSDRPSGALALEQVSGVWADDTAGVLTIGVVASKLNTELTALKAVTGAVDLAAAGKKVVSVSVVE